MPRSATYIVAIVALAAGLAGSLLLTVLDPAAQALFDSALYTSNTQYGQDALQWHEDAWNYWPALILVGILFMVWITTRRPE